MAGMNSDRARTLLGAIQGEGKPVVFAADYVEKGRDRYSEACEKSEMEERSRRARAIEQTSRIYLNM